MVILPLGERVSIAEVEQGERDVKLLEELIGASHDLSAYECEAFEGMLGTIESGRFQAMTAKQRRWANDVAQRLRIEPSEGPEDDGAPKETRFTNGPVPRGKEVQSMVKGLAKVPPGRRT